MKLFKSTKIIFEKHFFKLALAQLALFFSSLFFLVFVKGKLAQYLRKIQEFGPSINQIITTADKTNPLTISQSTTVIDSINQITNQALFFATIVVPIVLLLFWIIFQAIFWRLSKKVKIKNNKKYFLNLTIPSAIVLIASLSYLTKAANLQDFIGTLESFAINITGVVFIVLYFLTVYYAILDNQSLKQALKQTFKLTIKKFYKYIPIYIPLFLNTVLIMWFLSIGIMQQYTAADFFNPLLLLLGILITLTISIFYKIIIQKIVENEK